MKRHRRLAFVGAVAGIAILAPYTLNALAKLWPNSPVATLNNGLKGN